MSFDHYLLWFLAGYVIGPDIQKLYRAWKASR